MKRGMMNTINRWTRKLSRRARGLLISFAIPAMWAMVGVYPSAAQQSSQQTFPSAAEASQGLFQAVQHAHVQAIANILGGPTDLTSCGDEAQDKVERELFVQKYQEMHRLVKEPDGTTALYIGAKNWPTPIPLVKSHSWYFDAEAGKKEILYRRVGRNELSAIRVCQELVAAEKEYYSTQHNEFAQKITSDQGLHNGLYWQTADGEPQSPIGPLVASAVAEGYWGRLLASRMPSRAV